MASSIGADGAAASSSVGLGLEDSGSGSVMAEMMALFTPPGRDAKRNNNPILNPRPVELHPYFKRPGKGHNHDCCDACGEGGDLICCDNCPASFHFSCHAPPLDEEDIPMGDWICLRCYVREKSRLETIKSSTSTSWIRSSAVGTLPPPSNSSASSSGTSNSPAPETELTNPNAESSEPMETSENSSSRLTRPSRSAKSSTQKKQLEQAIKTEKENKLKLYKVKYDKYLEPKPLTNSPFDTLIAASQVVNAELFALPHELETFEPLPFSWKWSDERRDDFETNPKNCTNCRKSARRIPSIRCDFCPCVFHLDCLDPPLCDVPKERWMCPNHVEHFLDSKLLTSTSLTERMKIWQKYSKDPISQETVKLDFMRKAKSGKLFQKSRVKIPLERRVKVPQNIKDQYAFPLPGFAQTSVTTFQSQQQVVCQPEKQMNEEGSKPLTNEDQKPKEEEKVEIENEFLEQIISFHTSYLERQLEQEKKLRKEKTEEENMDTSENEEKPKKGQNNKEQKKKINEKMLKKSEDALDSDCDTASNCSLDENDYFLEEGIDLSKEIFQELKEFLARNRNKDLQKLPQIIKDFLAMQRLKEIFPDNRESINELSLASQVQARAALTPINAPNKGQAGKPSLMRYRTFNIGLGSGNELNLEDYGFCNFANSKHATIYFDQFSQVFELINYSEHGTIVDNQVYALHCRSPVKGLVKANKLGREQMSSKPEGKACFCETSAAKMLSSNSGCENSALLHHGSYIRIGCLQFAFSILDYYPNNIESSSKNEKKKK